VGASPDVEPDVYRGEVRPGDVYLVASDGLTGMVDDRRLQSLLLQRVTPDRKVHQLISEANGRGGLDNITAIVVEISDVEGSRPDTPTGPMATQPRQQ
jgi:protein phosphatase